MEHKTGSLKEVFFFRKKIVLEQETRTQLMTAKLNGISLIRDFVLARLRQGVYQKQEGCHRKRKRNTKQDHNKIKI